MIMVTDIDNNDTVNNIGDVDKKYTNMVIKIT